MRDAVDLQAAVSKIAVNDLTVRPKGGDDDWVTVPSLLVSGTTVDLSRRQAHADSGALSGVKLVPWREADGSLNLLKRAQSPPAPPAAAASVPPATTAAAPPSSATPPSPVTPPWKFDLRELSLRETSISADDRSTSPAVEVVFALLPRKDDRVSVGLAQPVGLVLSS